MLDQNTDKFIGKAYDYTIFNFFNALDPLTLKIKIDFKY